MSLSRLILILFTLMTDPHCLSTASENACKLSLKKLIEQKVEVVGFWEEKSQETVDSDG